MDTKSHLSSRFQSRAPLSERNNTTSPPSARWVSRDSDESAPSHHSSIFDACCMPCEWDTAKVRRVSPRPVKIPPPNQPTKIRLEDLQSESPLSRLGITPFLYGHGTELHPIAEQRSVTTLRAVSYSTSDLSSFMLRPTGSRTQAPIVQAGRSRLRRKNSFSLDDLDCLGRRQTRRLGHDVPERISSPYSPIGSESYTPAPDLHKYPYSPPYSPPARDRSPSGQLANRIPDDPSRGFRGPRSGHGNMRTHPWVRLVQNPASGAGSGPNQSRQRNPTDGSSSDGNSSLADTGGRGTLAWTCKRCHRSADAQWSL